MKKNFQRLSLMAMACLASSAAYAYDAQVGGIYYNFHGTEAEVTYLAEDWDNTDAYTGTVTIPEQVNYGGQTYTINIAAGDTDRDGTLSISDVSKLVDKLLKK